MAKSVNRVILLGNSAREPDIRTAPSGAIIAEFTLATNERRQTADSKWVDHTEWHRLVAFASLAETVRDNVKKGTRVYVEGKLETRSWQDKKSGEKRYQTQVRINTIVFADPPKEKDHAEEEPTPASWTF